jgi:sulfate transport system ATP-binding protein
MEISDQIIVINDGQVEQSGAPGELYDHPDNDFVMGFLGPVTRLGGTLVRPHDIEVSTERSPDAHRATVDRVVTLGFEVRLVVRLESGDEVTVQLTRGQGREIDVQSGDTVWLRAYLAPATPTDRKRGKPRKAGSASVSA